MRADRLLSLLLLIQRKDGLTTQALAQELEVSERTIFRDLEALSRAGAPVYVSRGPGGGWHLLPNYKLSLNWLTRSEVRLLSPAIDAGPLQDLDANQHLQGTWLKLLAALPSTTQQIAEQTRQRVYLDAAEWWKEKEPVPHLHILQEALWGNRKIHLTYRRQDGIEREWVIGPLGLVAKGTLWYLVGAAGSELQVFRVARVVACTITEEPFERPEHFDLPAFWHDWVARFVASFSRQSVTIRISFAAYLVLARIASEAISAILEQPDPSAQEKWLKLALTFESLEAAERTLLGFGTGIEVLEPQELRQKMARTALDLAALYSSTSHLPKAVPTVPTPE